MSKNKGDVVLYLSEITKAKLKLNALALKEQGFIERASMSAVVTYWAENTHI